MTTTIRMNPNNPWGEGMQGMKNKGNNNNNHNNNNNNNNNKFKIIIKPTTTKDWRVCHMPIY